tara:strand:+ start:577 stop:1089 length:513 start_codon:yes stop_codon:yes gene_type:complete
MSTNLQFINSVTVSGVTSTVNLDNVFSANYEVYKLVVIDYIPSSSENLSFRLLDSSGSALSGSDYDIATLILRNNTSATEVRVTNTSLWTYGGYVTNSNTQGFGLEMDIYNPFSDSSYTFANLTSVNGASADIGNKNIYVYKQNSSTRGLQFSAVGGNLKNLKAIIYGVK